MFESAFYRIGCFTASYPLHSKIFWSYPYRAVALHESHTGVASRNLTRNLILHRHSNILDAFCQGKTKGAGFPPHAKAWGFQPEDFDEDCVRF